MMILAQHRPLTRRPARTAIAAWYGVHAAPAKQFCRFFPPQSTAGFKRLSGWDRQVLRDRRWQEFLLLLGEIAAIRRN
ncbi:hypothetical protein KCP69_11115 [Salmonella enterica subsp. enterica]|nr:hypothetical protein KCP69_11115 [Salmonella enterica subsp. enterica]